MLAGSGGGGANGALLVDPDEVQGFAAWLDRASDEPDRAGSCLSGLTVAPELRPGLAPWHLKFPL
jgi:hypothetical protein